MDYNLLSNLQYCKDIVDGMFSFILYSHVPAAVIALLVAGYVLYRAKSLASRVLFSLAFVFLLWVVLDLAIWVGYDHSSILMTAWSVLGLLTALMFILVFYFVYVLVFERDMPRWMFVLWMALLVPVLLATPTHFNLTGFDIRDCVAIENPWFTNYYYGIGVLVFILLPIIGYAGWKRASSVTKKGIPMAIAGAELFLLAFFTTGVLASYLVDSNIISDFGLEQYGIIAMAVFMAFLAYVIVKYQEFKIKLIATQALVFAIVILVASEFTFAQNATNYVLVSVTVTLAAITGYLLTKSVKKEIAQREFIEHLALELEKSNTRLEGLLRYIGHEVKGFMAKDEAALASLSEGDQGALPEAAKAFVDQALTQSRHGVRSVTDLLTASNLKKGTVSYAKEEFDLKALLADVVEKARATAEAKGLALSYTPDESQTPYTVTGDKTKIADNVLRNVIDNAVNYTPSGSIAVTLGRQDSHFVITVEDTGVGISAEDMKNLFTEGGHGKDSQKINVHSTGYGLFIAKSIVEAHGGTIRAESEGEGKGATFVVTLPIEKE